MPTNPTPEGLTSEGAMVFPSMPRIDLDEYFLAMAQLTASRGTCRRRKVGCILVNEINHVIATGYNGPPRGFPHCLTTACPGAYQAPGEGLELCEAIHAEQNALLQCHDVEAIATCYSVASPCIHCVKLLLNTGCQRIVFSEEYPHAAARVLWLRGNREWVPYKIGSRERKAKAEVQKAKS